MKGYVFISDNGYYSEIISEEGVYLNFEKAFNRLVEIVINSILEDPFDFIEHNYPFEEEEYEIKEEVFTLYDNGDLRKFIKLFKENYYDIIKQFCKHSLIGECYNLVGLDEIKIHE